MEVSLKSTSCMELLANYHTFIPSSTYSSKNTSYCILGSQYSTLHSLLVTILLFTFVLYYVGQYTRLWCWLYLCVPHWNLNTWMNDTHKLLRWLFAGTDIASQKLRLVLFCIGYIYMSTITWLHTASAARIRLHSLQMTLSFYQETYKSVLVSGE